MTTGIRDRIEDYTNLQLDAVIAVFESLGIDEQDADFTEYALCDAPQDKE